MKTVLITGSSGFLGRNFTDLINEKNLRGRYDFLTPSSSELDLLDANSTSIYFNEHKIDCLISFAAICGGLGLNQRQPADLTHNNNKMTVNIFDMLRKHNIKQFISLGSVCSYPAFCKVPFKEEDMWGPPSERTNRGYGESKKMLITEFKAHMEQYGILGAILVPTNMYGYHDHFSNLANNHVVPALINKIDNAINNDLSIVYCQGDGTPTRDLIFCGSVCEAILTVLENDISSYEPINIGSGTDISIKELAHMLADLMGYSGEIVFDGTIGNGQQKRLLSVQKAKDVLNWEPTVSLKEGLIKTIDWYRKVENMMLLVSKNNPIHSAVINGFAIQQPKNVVIKTIGLTKCEATPGYTITISTDHNFPNKPKIPGTEDHQQIGNIFYNTIKLSDVNNIHGIPSNWKQLSFIKNGNDIECNVIK